MIYSFECTVPGVVNAVPALSGNNVIKCLDVDAAYYYASGLTMKPVAAIADTGFLDFNLEATELSIGGMLLLFVVGLGVGLIASQVRKIGKF